MRLFDHCVLPVSDLGVARKRLTALGFTVAADAHHPFGTANACVYFSDDTYLEPLAIADHEKCERTGKKGNQFTLRDQTFRFRNGDNGFSAIALKTDNADQDHKAFQKEGITAGRKLLFGRTMTAPDGAKARATFKLAFAADLRAPDSFGFTCQRVGVPKIDRSELERHDNGVTGISEIIASEHNPADFQHFLQTLIGNSEIQTHAAGMTIAMANCRLDVMTPQAMEKRFGVKRTSQERGLRYEGIVFTCNDLDKLKAICAKNNVPVDEQGAVLTINKQDG